MKRFLYQATGLLLMLFTCSITAYADNIVVDNFDSNIVGPEWHIEGTTFALTAENEALNVAYNRTASSWEWDQFHYIFGNKPTLSQYQIVIRLKSDVATELAVKPVNADGSSDWLTKNISVSSNYQEYTFSVPSANTKQLETIYFYFDAGTTTLKSGHIIIDQIIINTTSTALLSLAVENASLFISNAGEGATEGKFPQASISAFVSAKNAAQQVLLNELSTQSEIDAAVFNLNEANYSFEASRVRSDKLSSLELACSTASYETQNLFFNLRQIARYNTLFGMQDATGYGVGWSGNNRRGDVEDVCGSLPAVCSYSIKDVAKGQGWDDSRDKFSYIYNKGGIITLEWHMDNLYGGDFYWSNNPYPDSNVVKSMLPGGVNHNAFKIQLDHIALFLRNLKGDKGESIPVIFRPWHEHNGNWFWWGDPHCTVDEYKQLWQFTVNYLVDDKKVNNVLFAYSPDKFNTKQAYMLRYPGDEYIDILGFDNYADVKTTAGIQSLLSQLRYLVEMAEVAGKIPALTESGLEGVTNAKWFTQFMLEPIKNDPVACRIAYQAVWRNANTTHHYAPYPGHASVPDFKDFYNDPWTIFLNDMPAIYDSAMQISGALGLHLQPAGKPEGIRIFPNPTHNYLNISNASSTDDASYTVVDLIGNKIGNGSVRASSSETLALTSFPKGVYILKLTSKKGSLSEKIIIH